MHALSAIGILIAILGGAIAVMGLTSGNQFVIMITATAGANGIIGGLVLVGFGRVVIAAEEVAQNTRPLRALAGRYQQPEAEPVESAAADEGFSVVAEHDRHGRVVRELADGSLVIDTLTGPKKFQDWQTLEAYIR